MLVYKVNQYFTICVFDFFFFSLLKHLMHREVSMSVGTGLKIGWV